MAKIALLGCGFMAKAIAGGLIEKKTVEPESIIAINAHNPASAESFAAELGTKFGRPESVSEAAAVIICFKPQQFVSAMPEYAQFLHEGQLLISIMAGIAIEDIRKYLKQGVSVIRAMPNLAISAGYGATAYAPGEGVTEEQLHLCEEIFGSLGIVSAVPEEAITGVTALSGSGPAYFYFLAEGMINAAVEAGMDRETAERLCRQTFIGTAELWKRESAPPEEMRRRITSAKGTTDAAIRKMDALGLFAAVSGGMKACRERSEGMGREMLGK